MKEEQADLIDELLLDVRFNHEGIAYLKNFASWVVKFDQWDLRTNKREFIHLAQLAAEFSKTFKTAGLGRGLAEIVRSGINRGNNAIVD